MILHRMIGSIPWFQSVPNSLQNSIVIFKVVLKYLNSSTVSKELFSILILWLRPEFWSRDMILYWVLSTFTARTISILAPTKASVFFSAVCTLSPTLTNIYDGNIIEIRLWIYARFFKNAPRAHKGMGVLISGLWNKSPCHCLLPPSPPPAKPRKHTFRTHAISQT